MWMESMKIILADDVATFLQSFIGGRSFLSIVETALSVSKNLFQKLGAVAMSFQTEKKPVSNYFFSGISNTTKKTFSRI